MSLLPTTWSLSQATNCKNATLLYIYIEGLWIRICRSISCNSIHHFSSSSLLDEKRKELGDAANKLGNGLEKLVDTKQKVEQMSVELEQTKIQLATYQKECDEYLIIIVQQKRDAEEQEKTVAAHSIKIAEEEVKCKVLADAAQKDLDEALPALEEAMKVYSI